MNTEEGNIWKRASHDALKYKKARKKKCDVMHIGMAFGIILMLSIGSLGVVNGQEGSVGNLSISEVNGQTISNSQESVVDASREVTNTRLTFSSSDDRQPSWSPDSQWIAFMSRTGTGWAIKKIKLSDRSITTLPGGAGGIEPAWSPNGAKVAFSRGTSDSTMDVYVMNSDGYNVQKLTNTPEYDEYPDWSSDGSKIAYVSQWSVFNGPKYIAVMNADGSNKRNLGIVGIQPAWSPDGTKIAYKCYRSGTNICVINADGSNLRQLTHESGNTHNPDWSPNGQYITYSSNSGGDWEIYVINADGTNKRQLTSNGIEDNYPAWSPDGQYIAYSSSEDIWVMGINGGSIPTPSSGISVTSPNGGEYWVKGTTKPIKWSYTGNTGSNVKIELLKAGSVNSLIASNIPIGSNGYGSYNWNIPTTQTLGSDYKIKVTSITDVVLSDTSNNNFVISNPYVRVISANGGENWRRGIAHTITWTSGGSVGNYVKIELLKAGIVNRVISSSTANDGSFSWTIPSTQTTGTDYKIRITSTTNSIYKDLSNSNFVISS